MYAQHMSLIYKFVSGTILSEDMKSVWHNLSLWSEAGYAQWFCAGYAFIYLFVVLGVEFRAPCLLG
jgi:hypothetical protein